MDYKQIITSLMGTPGHGSGSGSALNPVILITAGICAFTATFLASFSIWLQLKNYRRPILQRQVVRIMLMIPLYAISSFISLFSLEAAVVIDALRDIYEAFVIYNFFHLLLDYLGGERSLLILLHGRPPKHHIFPVSLFKSEIDVSDPFTFLFLKRGILQYVQIKPILAVVTLILKATDTYKEGDLRADAGYLYVSIVYNISIFVALYCLAVFWIVINDDVKPFRPMPKFLCIKGILFFCFWQTITVSILVSPLRLITHIGPYTDVEHISIAISDVLICYEMPFFAIAHMYAFSHTDYIDPLAHYAARLRFWYAARDAFGLRDVIEDSKATLHSTVNYRTYEPVEGGMHVGAGRDRRIRAGLRYARGGAQKYWLPMPEDDEMVAPAVTGPLSALQRRWHNYQGYAPIMAEQSEQVVHEGFQDPSPNGVSSPTDPFQVDYIATDEEGLNLHFESPSEDQQLESMYEESRRLVFGDYNYPVIDVSTEAAKIQMWDEEERILSNERSAAWNWTGRKQRNLAYSAKGAKGYGATSEGPRASTSKPQTRDSIHGSLPHPAVIDYSQDTIPNVDINGIQLRWAKTGAAIPTRSGSSQGEKGRERPTPTRSESKAKKGDPQPEHVPDPNEPSEDPVDQRDDAIDLVVEDRKAGQLEMEWERRKGEPALTGEGGLKKVYRRKYDIDEDEEMEIDEARNAAQDPHDLPERLRVNIKEGKKASSPMRGGDNSSEAGLSPWTRDNVSGAGYILTNPSGDSDMVISRETAPPPHAQLRRDSSQKRPSDDEENPWG